jgi:GNAT superfamily N-acetyltransferase
MEPEKVVLEPGTEVIIRQIRPEDRNLMMESFAELSPQARYQRFFAPVERLSGADLSYLTEIDHANHEALVAIDPDEGTLVGVARYVRTRPRNQAEVAVVVGDQWQGKGLATALLQRLVQRASEEGIEYFLALVLETNRNATEFFENLIADAAETSKNSPGQVEIRIELPGPENFKDSVLARALGHSARGALRVSPWRRLRRRLARNRRRRNGQPD